MNKQKLYIDGKIKAKEIAVEDINVANNLSAKQFSTDKLNVKDKTVFSEVDTNKISCKEKATFNELESTNFAKFKNLKVEGNTNVASLTSNDLTVRSINADRLIKTPVLNVTDNLNTKKLESDKGVIQDMEVSNKLKAEDIKTVNIQTYSITTRHLLGEPVYAKHLNIDYMKCTDMVFDLGIYNKRKHHRAGGHFENRVYYHRYFIDDPGKDIPLNLNEFNLYYHHTYTLKAFIDSERDTHVIATIHKLDREKYHMHVISQPNSIYLKVKTMTSRPEMYFISTYALQNKYCTVYLY